MALFRWIRLRVKIQPIAILFRMGQLCLEPSRLPIFIMSADKLLINAAEQMAEEGFFVTILLFDNRLEAMAMNVHRLQLNLDHTYDARKHNTAIAEDTSSSMIVSPPCFTPHPNQVNFFPQRVNRYA